MSFGPADSVPVARREDRLRAILDRIDELPSLPEFIARLLAAVEEPAVSGERVAEIVSEDQAMTAAVLKLVNSPYYGLSRRIGSIQHAVLLLGFRTVRNLALSAVLVKSFGRTSNDRRFQPAALWRHAVASAAGARLLALRLGADEAEEAFLAGLVHDMGIVIIDQYLHEEFRAVLDLVSTRRVTLREAEREVLGRDHAFIGALLARRWNFPGAVVEAIGCHHAPWRAKRDPRLAAIVHLANAREGENGFGPVVIDPEPVAAAVEGVDAVEVDAAVPGVDPAEAAASVEAAAVVEIVEARRFAPGWDSEPYDPRALEILGMQASDLNWFRAEFAEEWDRARVLIGLLS